MIRALCTRASTEQVQTLMIIDFFTGFSLIMVILWPMKDIGFGLGPNVQVTQLTDVFKCLNNQQKYDTTF